ncbi:MAG: magnesium protoporphyrin IX methyltransferase [Pseudomonadota bacterium]
MAPPSAISTARPGLDPGRPSRSHYEATRARVETYFDRTATDAWARLTSDAPVSRIRATVREGRNKMRAAILARLPADLVGVSVLDAGCGAGQMTAELAARGAMVTAVDLSPQLVEIAQSRLPDTYRSRVRFETGDMLAEGLGTFDAVVAMDSLIYYSRPDLASALDRLSARAGQVVFTVAPRTPVLTAMWWAGRAFPKSDRSPVMVPQAYAALAAAVTGTLTQGQRIHSGFYIAECLELRR